MKGEIESINVYRVKGDGKKTTFTDFKKNGIMYSPSQLKSIKSIVPLKKGHIEYGKEN